MNKKIHVKFNVSPEEFLADLTHAAYQVALKAGCHVPFIKMELDLHSALREVIREDMLVSDDSASHQNDSAANKVKPWSLAAKTIFEKIEAEYARVGLGHIF